MGLFSKTSKPEEVPFDPTWPPRDAEWARTAKGRFHNLITFDPEDAGLKGVSGVFVVWHGGVQPEWVYAARASDLADAIDAVLDDEDVLSYHRRGGLFVTWSTIKPGFQDGVVRYLNTVMQPKVTNEHVDNTVKPVSVRVPGARDDDSHGAPAAQI